MEKYLLWLEAIAGIKTLYELTKNIPADLSIWDTKVESYRISPETIREAQQANLQYSTYSEEELQDLIDRIKGCRDRAIREGDPKRRVNCLCSVLAYAKDGNGGDMPDVADWQEIYNQLKCASRG
jgi:hypothetical protein